MQIFAFFERTGQLLTSGIKFINLLNIYGQEYQVITYNFMPKRLCKPCFIQISSNENYMHYINYELEKSVEKPGQNNCPDRLFRNTGMTNKKPGQSQKLEMSVLCMSFYLNWDKSCSMKTRRVKIYPRHRVRMYGLIQNPPLQKLFNGMNLKLNAAI